MFPLAEIDDYKLFLPPSGSSASGLASWSRASELNQAYLDAHRSCTPRLPITGSFIYAHPPNYRGYDTLHYSKSDWLRELGRLKLYGMDTVIFQASLWNELGECYYPSRHFHDFKQWNVIEPMLEAAAELQLTVFLGGYGSITCWMDKLSNHTVDAERERQLICFDELLQYGDLFQGFYFAPESAYTGKRDTQRETFLRTLYGNLFQEIKSSKDDVKILMSPATFYYPDTMDDMGDAWNSLLDGVALDILAPQDSVGCSCIDLGHQDAAFRQWRKVADQQHLRLWSNVEVFDLKLPFGGVDCRCTADLSRIRTQMANASPYVEKLITWEALFYTSPAGGPHAPALREHFLAPA